MSLPIASGFNQSSDDSGDLPSRSADPPSALPALSYPGIGSASAFSRDEMNLAEFPLTVLSTRADPKVKTLEFSDHLRLKSGEFIERKWIITGADKFGLPTSTDDDVILGLIRLSMDDGFRNRKIYFTRYELLKALRWSTEGRSYSRLTKSLDRLSGVRIRATNSFYDNSSKSYQTCNFGIIDAYEINDSRSKKGTTAAEPESFFIWSEMIFDSFRAGFIKKLDLDLYFCLKSAVSRRLYRYLDKHFYFRSTLEKPLMTLAFEKLGLSRTYRYVSSIRQQIEPALEELIKVGFLTSYEIVGRGEQAAIRFVAGSQSDSAGRQSSIKPTVLGHPATMAGTAEPAITSAKHRPSVSAKPDSSASSSQARDSLIEALVSRGISVAQAKRLLDGRSAADFRAIDRIIRYYDQLVEQNDPKVSRSKIGFLYRAVESPYKFSIPAGFDGGADRTGKMQPPRSLRPELQVYRAEEGETKNSDRAEYREYLDRAIASGLRDLGSNELAKIHGLVEQKMNCLKTVLSKERFQEAINGCVKEELIRVFSLPSFESWLSKA